MCPYRARWNPDTATPEVMLPLACPSTDTANVERWAKQWRDAGVEVRGNKVAEKDKAKADEVNRRLSKGRLSFLPAKVRLSARTSLMVKANRSMKLLLKACNMPYPRMNYMPSIRKPFRTMNSRRRLTSRSSSFS